MTDKDRRHSPSAFLDRWLSNLEQRAMTICALVGLVVIMILASRLPPVAAMISAQELAVQDSFFSVRDQITGRPHSLGDEIVLVCVDSDSARRLNISASEAMPRRIYAQLLKRLQEAGAQVIGFDIPLETAGLTADDSAFAKELQDAKNVVLSSNIDLESRVRNGLYKMPDAPFVDALGVDSGSVGNALIQPDSDGLVRHLSLVFDQFKGSAYFYKSFALRVAEKQMDAKAMVDTPDRLFLRKHVYPTDIRLNFIGPTGGFKMVPLWRALEWEKHMARHGLFLENSDNGDSDVSAVNPFHDKIVLVGVVSNASENKAPDAGRRQSSAPGFATPVSLPNVPMSDVEVHANAVANLLHERFLYEPDLATNILLIFALSLLFGRLLGKMQGRPWAGLGLVVAFSVCWLAGATFSFICLHTLVPVVVPIAYVAFPSWLLVVADSRSFARREKRKRIRIFRSLAAKPLAQEIERKLLAELGLEGKRMTVTVLACQMRGFGEKNEESAEAVMQRLNACLSVMMSCVGDYNGLVERIWNCGIIAIWGAPIAMAEEKQAKMATDCALAMRKRLFELHDSGESAVAGFNFTCGINTGESICGTINAAAGDTSLTQYGALGSAVDLAVELESLNPGFGTTFIIGPATATLVDETFEVREIDRLKLGRRENAQSVYELLPWEGSMPGALEEAMALFKQGRAALEEGRVHEAEQLFATSLRMVPHDKPTMIMLERCKKLISSAPSNPDYVQKLSLKERLTEGP
ncbi:MAG TPA: adenylate/guanylate cyclase domain-containing protein [Planktothrix sp.]